MATGQESCFAVIPLAQFKRDVGTLTVPFLADCGDTILKTISKESLRPNCQVGPLLIERVSACKKRIAPVLPVVILNLRIELKLALRHELGDRKFQDGAGYLPQEELCQCLKFVTPVKARHIEISNIELKHWPEKPNWLNPRQVRPIIPTFPKEAQWTKTAK